MIGRCMVIGSGWVSEEMMACKLNVRAARIVRGHKGCCTTGFIGIAILAVSRYPL
jgi:hypothetical protein